jgi:molybdopterin/thiamine biosynthesis adenylyltransferase
MIELSEKLSRYHRQVLLPDIGVEGQMRLRQSNVLVIGCGALGTVLAETLTRAGVGSLTIVDRDVIELTNLQRQVLFNEEDLKLTLPKAQAAYARLHKINSQVHLDAYVEDFNHRNADRFIDGVDLILDGLDNFETRYLLNDLAVKHGVPFIYGGAVGTTGMSMPILPHSRHRAGASTSNITWSDEQATPCLRCVFPEAPPPGSSPTCDTVGVLGPVVGMIASYQAAQAIKLLTGNLDALDRRMLSIDLWSNEFRQLDVTGAGEDASCPCCGKGVFDYIEGRSGSTTTSLCGRNAVQISPADEAGEIDLAEIALRLMPHVKLTVNRFLLRGTLKSEKDAEGNPMELTLFPNGRAIIKGTNEPEEAKSIYAKYVGS